MPSTARRLAPAAVAVALSVVLGACSDSGSAGTMPGMDHGAPGMSSTAQSGTTPAAENGRAGDVMFAQMMIPHHEQAVEMADFALGKDGVSPEVRQLATRIKAAQDPEIQTMRGWLQAWGAPVPTGMGDHDMGGTSGQGMMSQADMDDLEAAEGAAFDAQWVTMMIAHHEGAVTMARQVLGTTSNAEVKALAEAVVKTQTDEIATLKGLS